MITKDRLEEIDRLLSASEPRGFRAECRELRDVCYQLMETDRRMRTSWGDMDSPHQVEEICRSVSDVVNSTLHLAAANAIHTLLGKLKIAEDAAADAVDPARIAKAKKKR